MKERMQQILERMHRYNRPDMAKHAFGLDAGTEYDALVVAPSYTPWALKLDAHCRITTLKEGAYIAGYLVEADGCKIAWIQIGSSDGNLIDHVAVCAELNFKRMIFIGAVGALRRGIPLGTLCTPSYSIAGGIAHSYLQESIRDYVPFQRVEAPLGFANRVVALAGKAGIPIQRASVFCTPSIVLEYLHLEEILAFGTDLIEMETAAFYQMAELLEIPSIALLVVSDNSAAGAALVGRSQQEQASYDRGKLDLLPRAILLAANAPIQENDYENNLHHSATPVRPL